MAAPVALQLYSVREAIAQRGFEEVIRAVATMGYTGVEPAGFPGTTPSEARQLFDSLELTVTSAHLPLPLGDQRAATVEIAGELGIERIVGAAVARDGFADADALARLIDTWNEAGRNAAESGLQLGLHNHYWEFAEVDGKPGFEHLMERLDESVFFEVDTYWVQTGGGDVSDIVSRLGARAPLLHIKDGPCSPQEDMQAVGDGVMDFPAVIAAAGGVPDWLIVELDRCATDMMEAVAKSVRYLVDNGLGR